MTRRNARVALDLPEEFLDLCEYDLVSPEKVLREFIADVCTLSRLGANYPTDTYICNHIEDRDRAKAYYEHLHGWKAEWLRKNLPHLVDRWREKVN